MTVSLRRLGNCFSKLNLSSFKTEFPKASISTLSHLGRQTSLQPVFGDQLTKINGLRNFHQSSSFSTHSYGQNCVLSLYSVDISGVKEMKIAFFAKEAKKVSDLAARYFDLYHES